MRLYWSIAFTVESGVAAANVAYYTAHGDAWNLGAAIFVGAGAVWSLMQGAKA